MDQIRVLNLILIVEFQLQEFWFFTDIARQHVERHSLRNVLDLQESNRFFCGLLSRALKSFAIAKPFWALKICNSNSRFTFSFYDIASLVSRPTFIYHLYEHPPPLSVLCLTAFRPLINVDHLSKHAAVKFQVSLQLHVASFNTFRKSFQHEVWYEAVS